MAAVNTPAIRTRIIRSILGRTKDAAVSIAARARRTQTPRLLRKFDKLHLGSGSRLLDGWANLDINGLGTLVWDLRKPLPLKPGYVRFVYTEHFIEHISRDDAKRLFTHARQVMAPDAVVRVSTPDLKKLVDDYQAGQVVRMEHGGWFPATPCQMVNEAMRYWGHVFLYDEAELFDLLRECGFSNIKRVHWGESVHPDLRRLESRPDFADLILEATA